MPYRLFSHNYHLNWTLQSLVAKTTHETKENKEVVFRAHATIGLVYYSMGEFAHALELILASQPHQTESNQLLLFAAQSIGIWVHSLPPQVPKMEKFIFNTN